MPTFRLPIRCRTVVPPHGVDGPIRRILTAHVRLAAQDRSGVFRDVPDCRLDTGCSTTTISATLARSMGLPFSMAEPHRLPTLTVAGRMTATVYFGEVRVRFAVDPAHTFRLFCQFSEDHGPDTPMLLGLHDLLETFRVTFDGTSHLTAPMGYFRLETYA